ETGRWGKAVRPLAASLPFEFRAAYAGRRTTAARSTRASSAADGDRSGADGRREPQSAHHARPVRARVPDANTDVPAWPCRIPAATRVPIIQLRNSWVEAADGQDRFPCAAQGRVREVTTRWERN